MESARLHVLSSSFSPLLTKCVERKHKFMFPAGATEGRSYGARDGGLRATNPTMREGSRVGLPRVRAAYCQVARRARQVCALRPEREGSMMVHLSRLIGSLGDMRSCSGQYAFLTRRVVLTAVLIRSTKLVRQPSGGLHAHLNVTSDVV